jgi:hypothetical protein
MSITALLTSIQAAVAGKQWILLAAILVGAVVAAAKQGWLSAWLAKKLPPSALPYLAIGLGVLGTAATAVVSGKPLAQALVDGFSAGMAAIVGHETLVEGIRGGKELLPEKKSSFADHPPKAPAPAVDPPKAA